jgi:hypothetical protein
MRQRISELNAQQKMDHEIAAILNQEGPPYGAWAAALWQHGPRAAQKVAHPDCEDQRYGDEPAAMPDGTYSVQGAAATIGITPQIIFDWLRKGLLSGEQLAKGLSPEQAAELATQVRRTSRSGSEAS